MEIHSLLINPWSFPKLADVRLPPNNPQCDTTTVSQELFWGIFRMKERINSRIVLCHGTDLGTIPGWCTLQRWYLCLESWSHGSSTLSNKKNERIDRICNDVFYIAQFKSHIFYMIILDWMHLVWSQKEKKNYGTTLAKWFVFSFVWSSDWLLRKFLWWNKEWTRFWMLCCCTLLDAVVLCFVRLIAAYEHWLLMHRFCISLSFIFLSN